MTDTPTTKPLLYLISGVSGSGKSWVCSQLDQTKCSYISYDRNPKKDHLNLLLEASKLGKPIIYPPTFKISTFIRRHSDLFDIYPVFIVESKEVLISRLEGRGGTFTESMERRMKAIDSRVKKYGKFSGTSAEVLSYMTQLLSNQSV